MLDAAFFFLLFKLAKSGQEFVPVDDVTVDFGAVDAGVFAYHFAFDVDRNHARAAHAGGVDHDRVEAGDGFYGVGFGEVADGAHHQRWPDGDDFGDGAPFALFAVFEHRAERAGDKTFDAKSAVITGVNNVELLAKFGFELPDAFVFAHCAL